MKKLIITLAVCLLANSTVYAETVVVNPLKKVFNDATKDLYTTKIKTDEGIYRVFVVYTFHGVGITAVKIEKGK